MSARSTPAAGRADNRNPYRGAVRRLADSPMNQATRRTSLLLALLLACVLGAACRSAPDKRVLQYLVQDGFGNRYTGNAEEENYVTIGDSVTYLDQLNPDNKGQGTVEIDGTILVPELGAVSVAGHTRSEIEALLTEKLSAYYKSTDISVKIQTQGKNYFVFGEVGAKGLKPFKGDLTVFEAVMTATPTEHTANLGRVRVIRADPRDPMVIVVNVAQMLRSGDSTFNIQVQERDIIFVPPTMLAQLGYFISDLISPFTTVFKSLITALFSLNNFSNFGNNKNFNIF